MFDPRNPIAPFLNTRCAADSKWWERANDLYRVYLAWCTSTDQVPVSVTKFGRSLRQAGLRREAGHVVTWYGIRLL